MSAGTIAKGHKRQWLRCRVHGLEGYYDYVPYSLSTAVAVMPCGCDIKGQEAIDGPTTPTPDLPCPSKEAREILADVYREQGILYGPPNDILGGAEAPDVTRALIAIDKALSRHSASTVDVEGFRIEDGILIHAEGGRRPASMAETAFWKALATLGSFPSTLNGEG